MANSEFDIRSLLAFDPPVYRCKACLALLGELELYALARKVPEARCPVCHSLYVFEAEGAEHQRFSRYMQCMRSEGLAASYDLIEHAKELAYIASVVHEGLKYPPLQALMEALNQAKNFVHFTTYGMSLLLVGMFKMVA